MPGGAEAVSRAGSPLDIPSLCCVGYPPDLALQQFASMRRERWSVSWQESAGPYLTPRTVLLKPAFHTLVNFKTIVIHPLHNPHCTFSLRQETHHRDRIS